MKIRLTEGEQRFLFEANRLNLAQEFRNFSRTRHGVDCGFTRLEVANVKAAPIFPVISENRQEGRKKQLKNAHKAAQWSTLVSAHGNRIVTHVGDIPACDLVDPDGRKKAGLQFNSMAVKI